MNYNYMFLYYDVGEKRVNKVFKICKKYLVHCQNSVFRGEISPSLITELKSELQKVLKDEDEVVFIKLMNNKSFVEESVTQITDSKKDKKCSKTNEKFI